MICESPYTSTLQEEDDDEPAQGGVGVIISNYAFGRWINPVAAAYPAHVGGRPPNFPPSIDIFLWGALSTSIEDTFHAYRQKQLLHILIFTPVACGMILVPLANQTLMAFFYGTYEGFLLLMVGSIFLSCAIIHGSKLILLQGMHKGIQAIADDLYYKEQFAKAGFDIDFVVEKKWLSCAVVSYIRLSPKNKILQTTQEDTIATSTGGQTAQFTSQVVPRRPMRLMTYQHTGVCCFGSAHNSASPYTIDLSSTGCFPVQLSPLLKRSVFGALSETVRPVIKKYGQQHMNVFWRWFSAYYMLRHVVPLFIDMDESTRFTFDMCVFAFFLVMLVLWRPWSVYSSRGLAGECEEAVQAIAQQVEDRSGYSVRVVKPDENSYWFGESYIELLPKNSEGDHGTVIPVSSGSAEAPMTASLV